jgi:hypothetical protein
LSEECRKTLLREGFALGRVRGDDAWLDLLENAFDNADDERYDPRDLSFEAEGCSLACHAAVLAARCPVLARRFAERERVDVARLQPALLAALLRWCYTASFTVDTARAEEAARLLQQAGLPVLARQARAEAAAARGAARVALEPARADAKAELAAAFAAFLDVASDDELASDDDLGASEDAAERAARRSRSAALGAEQRAALRRGALRVRCGGGRSYFVHTWLLAPRSEYFAALRARWSAGGAALELDDITPGAMRALLRWAYTDALPAALSAERLVELLLLADRLLLEPLKQRAALCLVPSAEAAGAALPLLRLAEQAGCPRLAAAAAAAVAAQLETLAEDESLEACVAESAARIRRREAADTIPVLDEIRMHCVRMHGDGGALSDEEEEERWASMPEENCEQREAKARAMAASGGTERRRKMAILTILASRVQGWDVASARLA